MFDPAFVPQMGSRINGVLRSMLPENVFFRLWGPSRGIGILG